MAGNETIIAACQAAGATSSQYNTALMEFAVAAGATAIDLPTALFQAFTALGYTGSLSDMFRQWEVAGYPGGAGGGREHTVTVAGVGSGYYGWAGAAGAVDDTSVDDTPVGGDGATYDYTQIKANNSGIVWISAPINFSTNGWGVSVDIDGLYSFTTNNNQNGNAISNDQGTAAGAYVVSKVGQDVVFTLSVVEVP